MTMLRKQLRPAIVMTLLLCVITGLIYPGIVFTANPNSLESNELVIESSYGLGEAVVSGDVQPDNFIVDRSTRAIKRRPKEHKLLRKPRAEARAELLHTRGTRR